MPARLQRSVSPQPSRTVSAARYLELLLAIGIILTALNALHVFGGVVGRGWFRLLTSLLHLQFGLYGCALLATLLFVLPRLRLPAFVRIAAFAAFFIWLQWVLLWVLVRRAFGIELSTDIVWELFTNRAAIAAVGLEESEFALALIAIVTIGASLGFASDRIARGTSRTLLRRGCITCVALFLLLHLPLRAFARYHAAAKDQPIVVYHDYVPALLHFEDSGAASASARPALPNLESRARTQAYFDPRRLQQLPAIPAPQNIVWINLESFRFDAITPETMPRLSAYRDQFQIRLDRQHWSGGNATQFGIFSQLTGLSGYHLHNLSRAQMPAPFLALLAQNGYRLRVAKKHQLSYIGLSVLLPPATIAQEVSGTSRAEEDTAMTDAYLRDRETRAPAVHSFDFIAFDATHWPYPYPAAHAIFQPAPPLNGSQMILGFQGELEMVRNRYRNACHFVDEQIGRILDDLASRHALESTIVVVLGDHGEEFQERGQMTHAAVLNDFQARTPLWLHLPGIPPEPLSIDVPTTHMDIVPTILQALGFTEDVLYTQGHSLLSSPERRPVLALSDTGFRVPLYRTLVTETYISRWSLRPLSYLFAGIQRRDGAKVEGEDWLNEVRAGNDRAAEMYELLPDTQTTPRPFRDAVGIP